MCSLIRLSVGVAALALLVATPTEAAEETHLFNGKNLDGWTFHLQGEEPDKVEDPWIVERELLICRGVTSGYFIHKKEWANVKVAENVEFVADVRRLPYLADAREIQFQAVFGMLDFESPSSLTALFKFLTQQLRQKGYRETRRPIISDDRCYSEFTKGGVEISVNAFCARNRLARHSVVREGLTLRPCR